MISPDLQRLPLESPPALVGRGPRRVHPQHPAAVAGWPLHAAQAARALEAQAAVSLPPRTLMRRAGLALARLALALAPHRARTIVLCGPGNNGGDGLEAATHLHRWGRHVEVWLYADPDRLPTDAQGAWQQTQDVHVPVRRCHPTAAHPADPAWVDIDAGTDTLVIDALLGLGLTRSPQGLLAEAIAWCNRARARGAAVLAADLPSGLEGDSGSVFDAGACVQAHWTLSLLSLKPGLFTGEGRDVGGEVWWDDLDLDLGQDLGLVRGATDAPPRAACLTSAEQARGWRPARLHRQHKGSFGDLWVLGGAPSMQGALLLAARAGAAMGAGRVYACALDESAPRQDSMHPEIMFRAASGLREGGALAQRWQNACVVAGCGGGAPIGSWLAELIEHAPRLVLDADGLNALAADGHAQSRLRLRAARGCATVLTPHPLEAARLLDPVQPSVQAVQAQRLHTAAQLAERWQCTVLLKGSGTVIATPGHTPLINASGNARLASGGSGDVLAGMIGALLAQQLPAHLAAGLAAFEHGWVAEHGPGAAGAPLLASQLVEALSALAL